MAIVMLEAQIPVGGPLGDPDFQRAQAKIDSARKRMPPVKPSKLGFLAPKVDKIREGFAILDQLEQDDTIR